MPASPSNYRKCYESPKWVARSPNDRFSAREKDRIHISADLMQLGMQYDVDNPMHMDDSDIKRLAEEETVSSSHAYLFEGMNEGSCKNCKDSRRIIAGMDKNLNALTLVNQTEKAEKDCLQQHVQTLYTEIGILKEEIQKSHIQELPQKIVSEIKPTKSLEVFLPQLLPLQSAPSVNPNSMTALPNNFGVLSLESKYKDLMASNKRLLQKIMQLESDQSNSKKETEAIRNYELRAEGMRATISSQSTIILGLRRQLQDHVTTKNTLRSLEALNENKEAELLNLKSQLKSQENDQGQRHLDLMKKKILLVDNVHEEVKRQQRMVEKAQEDIASHILDKERLAYNRNVAEKRADKLASQCEQLREKLQEKERENSQLQESLENSREALRNRAKDTKKEEIRFAEVTVAKNHNDKTLFEELQRLQEKVKALRAQNKALTIELSHSGMYCSQDPAVRELQLSRKSADQSEALAIIQEENQSLSDKVTLLQKRLHDAEQRYQQQRVARIKSTTLETIDRVQHKSEAKKLDRATKHTEHIRQLEEDGKIRSEEFANAQRIIENLTSENKLLMTKMYKAESFRSQSQLLQLENAMLKSKIEKLSVDVEKGKALLAVKTSEANDSKAQANDLCSLRAIREAQESLKTTVVALMEAEASSEAAFTCFQCMQLYKEPVTLDPCGHTYCRKCLGYTKNSTDVICKECALIEDQAAPVQHVFANKALEDLSARFGFRQQNLSALSSICLSLESSCRF